MRKTKTPHPLLDALIKEKKLGNDKNLAERLGIDGASICRTRAGRPVSDHVRLAVMRTFGWSLKRVDALAPPEVKS